ncbi:hypothetical protein R83H12_02370 [Fibrobacteria bacterium R8-3-H12]
MRGCFGAIATGVSIYVAIVLIRWIAPLFLAFCMVGGAN